MYQVERNNCIYYYISCKETTEPTTPLQPEIIIKYNSPSLQEHCPCTEDNIAYL